MEFAASFSGGKDSTLAIKRMLDRGHRLVALIVSSKIDTQESWTHNIEKEYFEKAAEIFRCQVIFTDTSVDDYEKNFEKALLTAKKLGAQACIFGDIDIKEHIRWNNSRCKNSNIEAIHPLLFEDRESIVGEFLESKIKARIVKLDRRFLAKDFLGALYNRDFIEKLKILNLDPCGENGEFHTKIDLSSLRGAICKEVYVDNASTNFPKATTVSKAMAEFIDRESVSINRGSYIKSYDLSSKVIDVREKLLKFTNAPKDYSCIFAPSATELINMIIAGSLKEGDEIIIDDRIHNSAWRVLRSLDNKNIKTRIWNLTYALEARRGSKEEKTRKDTIERFLFSRSSHERNELAYDKLNNLEDLNYRLEDFESLLTNKTKAVFLTLVDNVTGFYNEKVIEVAKICKARGIMVFIDAVQAICEREVNLEKLKADALIFASHIGLMGPEGLAEMIISNECAKKIQPLVYGGTGSQSNSPDMPEIIPDKFEAGTMNLPAIIATGAAIDFIDYIGVDKIIEKKHLLGKKLREGLSQIEGLDVRGEGAFCSLMIEKEDEAIIAFNLDMLKSIMTRVGIHCSPLSHIVRGKFPNGSIRFSLGYFNNQYDVDYIIDSIKELLDK